MLRLLSRSQALPEAILLLAVISSTGDIGTAAALLDKVPLRRSTRPPVVAGGRPMPRSDAAGRALDDADPPA